MSAQVSMPSRLRAELRAGPVHAAGCFDALSARLAEDAGYKVAYISGLAVEATQLGSADIGLITRTEMAAHAARIAAAVDIPVLCDVDTGYGDVVNIGRTVHEFERAGVAGIQIEDQTDPKKCPLLGSPDVLDARVAVRRIRAAVEARRDPDFAIIGRTDAYEKTFDEVVRRLNLYLEAGADIALSPLKVVDGTPMSSLSADEQMRWHERFCAEVDGPAVAMTLPPGRTVQDMISVGYRVVVLPTASLQAAATAIRAALVRSLRDGTSAAYFTDNPKDERVVGVGLLKLLGAESAAETQRRLGPDVD
ncbi:isocitrate lyase/PEP mutase family protein [Streptomyces sp. NBC_01622]|uniref:isocitrate lyase/PEP mutase family protein n=1 Tax=Streptomyces sp. NBC_01622 TaxID=2975903 RepID=UPI003866F800|nr:isocitrate lyase/PEP mutase family protein [Streptomyces sp. NBC_01622]